MPNSKPRIVVGRFAEELKVYRLVITHPKTPRLARILLGAAVLYFLSPLDLIPDVIPVLGQLDDLLIVPGLVGLSLRMIPKAVIEECRARVRAKEESSDKNL